MLKKSSFPDISIVIPCFNEEENAEAIGSAVIAEIELPSMSGSGHMVQLDGGAEAAV